MSTANRIGLVLIIIASIGCTVGCGNADRRNEEEDRPEESKEVIDDSLLEKVESKGFDVHRGGSPPDITGKYVADSMEVEYDTGDAEGESVYTYFFEYTGLDDTGALKVEYGSDQETGSGTGANISGKDGCFTAYFAVEPEGVGCETYKKATLQTGCLTDEGIEEWQLASVITKKKNCITGGSRSVGDVRISNETDGIAEKTE